MKATWERPRTSRVYLHAPGSRKIVMMQPDFKLNVLDLAFVPRHTRQDAFGVHLLFGKGETEPVDFKETAFDRPRDGLPFFTVRNRDAENGCLLSLSAFATDDDEPVVYARVTVENPANEAVTGRVGLLPRYAKNGDQYLTGLWDTGYESYQPNWHQWLLMRDVRFSETERGTAAAENGMGTLKLLATGGADVRFVTREAQRDRFRAQDYFAADYALPPRGTLTLDFALSAQATLPFCLAGFDEARTRMAAFWKDLQSRITVFPETKDEEKQETYRHNVTQCLQMLARYRGKDGILVRQGDVGRYLWAFEAVHVLIALDRVGFAAETEDAYRTMVGMVATEGEKRGELVYDWVAWDNAESAVLWGIAEHMRYGKHPEACASRFRPAIRAMLEFIERRRHEDTKTPYPGLYPAGQASDWGEIGKHWTFTDAFQVRGITRLAEEFEKIGDEDAPWVRGIADSYRRDVIAVRDRLYAGHENDAEFILPHIAGIPFEESFNHCFYTDGAPYLPMLGLMEPRSRMFEQMEAYFTANGLFEHHLAGRVTNATDPGVGAYGDCYYTGISEFCWLYPWMARGEWDKADAMAASLFRYNLTAEYVVSERYCSFDPWYTPWQPNGSGSARIVEFLLDYFAAHPKADR